MENNRTVKKRVAKADKIIKGAKKGAAVVGTAGAGALVFVKANGPQVIKQAPKLASKVVGVVKNFI